MKQEEEKFKIYLTMLRFLVYKITENLRKIYLDIDLDKKNVFLTVLYLKSPSDIELELLDDIVTNGMAHLPNFSVNVKVIFTDNYSKELHDFVLFSFYEDI